MDSDKNLSMELVALTLLADSDRPVGSQRLAQACAAAGIDVAEATAGRFLRQLDQRGLTEVQGGKRGRLMTPQGFARLQELKATTRLKAHGANLVRAATATDLSNLIDLLLVRRAVETEAARLAALRGTDAELEEIEQQARSHRCDIEAGRTPGVNRSTLFHRSVAEASHNDMLISVALLLLEPANAALNKALEEVSVLSKVASSHAEEHLELAEALLARDASEAEEVMHRHLSRLIAPVEAHLTSLDSGPKEPAGRRRRSR